MIGDMVGDKGRHEEVRMVVAVVAAQRELPPSRARRGFQELRLELRFQELIGETLVNEDGRPLINDLRQTVRSAERTMANLDAVLADARPGVQAFSNQTLPEVGQLVRDLRATTSSLRDISDRLNQQGVGGVVGGQRLPDYEPGRRN